MTKKQVSQELEQIIAEEIEKALLDENIFGGLKNVAKGVASGAFANDKGGPGFVQRAARRVQDMYKKGSEEANAANRVRNSLENDLLLIASFIDASERYPAISKFIADTELGKALFSPQMHNEAYGANQLLQMMKNKKVDAPMVIDFFKSIRLNEPARKLLDQVKQMSGLEPQLVQTQQPQGQPQAGEIDTSGQPAVQQGAPERPKGDDVPKEVATGDEAKKMAKGAATNLTNQFFKDVYRLAAEEIEKMTDIDDQTKKEMANKVRGLAGKGGKNAKVLARQLDQQINALQENKQLERLKKLAGILKD